MKGQLSYRAQGVALRSPSTIDREERKLDLTVASEAPVLMYDWESGERVPEVLLAKGCIMPKQVPLLDTHSRDSTASVVGSVRGKRVEDGGLVAGTAYFSRVPAAEEAFTKYEEGHLTDFSAGYLINDVTRVKKGEKVDIDGRTWKGPVNVVTSWTIKEVSCCPIGADARAKARSDISPHTNDTTNHEDTTMEKERFEKLEGTVGKIAETVDSLAGAVKTITEQSRAEDDADKEIERLRQDKIRNAARAVQEERDRIRAIEEACERMSASTGIDFDDLRDQLIADGTPELEALRRINDRIHTAKPTDVATGLRVSFTKDEKEKSRDAAVDGIMLRAGVCLDKIKDRETEFQTMSMLELAKNRCLVYGQSIRGMDPMQIFQRALSTSDFDNILADVANKALLEGFESAEETYDAWADTSGRVNDFKPHTFARASEAPSLIEVNPDGGEYKYGKMNDAKETVAVVDYGIIVPFTRAAMINDDLGALSDIREKLGAASRRKYGDLVYAVLTGNPTMGDGKALFHADHANQTASSGGAPSVAALNTAAALMATQKDLQGVQNLNVRPQFILTPWALKGTVDNLLTSTSPTAPGSASSPVMNPWAYLQPVYDARLDANSAAKWYLAARKGMTVKLFTLNGNMTPVIESQAGWSVDGMEFKARITAAAKAVDYRGLYYNVGQ